MTKKEDRFYIRETEEGEFEVMDRILPVDISPWTPFTERERAEERCDSLNGIARKHAKAVPVLLSKVKKDAL